MSLVSGGEQDALGVESGDDDVLGSDIPKDDPTGAHTPARPTQPKTDPPTVRDDLKDHALDMARVTGTLGIDGIFALAVGAMNWVVDQVIDELNLVGLSATVFWWVQLLLAVGTIGTVAIRVVADLLVTIVRAWKQVRRG